MQQSITTHYHGATNTKPARIIAKASGGTSKTFNYNWDLNADANHIAAAEALCKSLDWGGQWVGGGRDNDGFVFVDVSAALEVWPCGTKEGASYGVRRGEGFPALEGRG